MRPRSNQLLNKERTRSRFSRELLIFALGCMVGLLTSSLVAFVCWRGPTSGVFSSDTAAGAVSIANNHELGWSSIHVYYGNASYIVDSSNIPNDYFWRTSWYSQYRQDEIVSQLLRGKQQGYFVDLASNDPIRISNTYALETHFDWTGLCIEPNAMYWPGLAFRKCNVVAAVIGSTRDEEVTFRFRKDKAPQGGIVGQDFDNKEPVNTDEEKKCLTVPLLEIFDRFHTPKVIDYMSLDVEGAETFIMKSFPFDRYRINVMTLERPDEELKRLLQSHNYLLLKYLRPQKESLWIHSSIRSELDLSALEIDSEHYKYRENRPK